MFIHIKFALGYMYRYLVLQLYSLKNIIFPCQYIQIFILFKNCIVFVAVYAFRWFTVFHSRQCFSNCSYLFFFALMLVFM